MPVYTWRCVHCDQHADTIEPINRYDVGPERHQHDDTYCPNGPTWERLISGAPRKQYAPGWGSNRKGLYNSQS